MHVTCNDGMEIPITCEAFDESFPISGDIEECNTSKFRATVLSPKMGNMRRTRKGIARINVNGMTCNKCVNFIQTKVSQKESYWKVTKSLLLGWRARGC